jgi:hypothetical protein
MAVNPKYVAIAFTNLLKTGDQQLLGSLSCMLELEMGLFVVQV